MVDNPQHTGNVGLDVIVEKARGFVGTKVPDLMVCTDVYVKAADDAGYNLSERLRDSFKGMVSPYIVYSQTDQRYRLAVRLAKFLIELMEPTESRFNNDSSNPNFTRRIQNLKPWQEQHQEYYAADADVELKPGMAVYWTPKRSLKERLFYSSEPTHVGVISEVVGGKVTKVIHASYSKGQVVEVYHSEVLRSMNVVGYGNLPKR